MNNNKTNNINSNPQILIQAKNLSFGYDKLPLIFEKVNFDIKEGEFIALIGANGSGKTTLIKVLLGLLEKSEGSVSILGNTNIQNPNSSNNSKQFWSQIGYIPQTPAQPKDFPITVLELLQISMLKKDPQAIQNSIQKLGIVNIKHKQLNELSGGQRQKVYIARAILNNPKIIFLDEPTSGIDQLSESSFYEIVAELRQNYNTAIVMISHDIGGISSKVDRIFCLDKTLEIINNPKEYPHNEHIHFLSHSHVH
jgi:zinc transport system ATP-binding protein